MALTSYDNGQQGADPYPDRAGDRGILIPESRPPVASFHADYLNQPSATKTPVEQFEPKPLRVQPPGVPAAGTPQGGSFEAAALRAGGYTPSERAGQHQIYAGGSSRDFVDRQINNALTPPPPDIDQPNETLNRVLTRGANEPTQTNWALAHVLPPKAPAGDNSAHMEAGQAIGQAVGQAVKLLPRVIGAAAL